MMAMSVETIPETMFDDDELTALALAADPDAAVPDDAVCLWDVVDFGRSPELPDWYMPAPTGAPRLRSGWRQAVAVMIVVAFFAVDAYGLSCTYGPLTSA